MSTSGYDRTVESTRDRLIDAATRLIDQGGPAAVTLREVGRLAGVSHNAPYKHFAGKRDLLAAVAARELRRMDDGREERGGRTPASGANGGDSDRVRQLMHAYVRWAMRYPARFKLTFGSWQVDSADLAEAATTSRATLVRAVQAAQLEGTVPPGDPDRAAALILALAHGAADLAISGHLSRTGKGHASAEDLVDDLMRHLARPGSLSPAADNSRPAS